MKQLLQFNTSFYSPIFKLSSSISRSLSLFNRRFYASLTNNPFSAPIPSSYIAASDKPLIVGFTISELHDLEFFVKRMHNSIPSNLLFLVFVKARYLSNKYCMIGNQFGFEYKSFDDLSSMHSNIHSTLSRKLDDYKINNMDISYVLFSFRTLDHNLTSDYTLDVPINDYRVSKSALKTVRSVSIIPVSVDPVSLGSPLKTEVSNNLISSIYLNINNNTINFLDLILSKAKYLPFKHVDKIVSFDKNFKFYYLTLDNKSFVIAVKQVDNNQIVKISYFLDGTVSTYITDTLLPGNIVSRVVGNTVSIIQDKKLVHVKETLLLKPIPKSKTVPIDGENPNIGVIDTETFVDIDGKSYVYAVGFKTNLRKNPILYYIDNSFNFSDIIIKMVNELLRRVYDKNIFYCHNLGGFDSVFIINALLDYNDKCKDNNNTPFKLNYIFRDKDIIQITISKQVVTKNNNKDISSGLRTAKLVIRDSLCLLNNSLRDLGVTYGVNTQKGYFPYEFVTRNTLFYVGKTPGYRYYKGKLGLVDWYKQVGRD